MGGVYSMFVKGGSVGGTLDAAPTPAAATAPTAVAAVPTSAAAAKPSESTNSTGNVPSSITCATPVDSCA